jgi:hypothetical protein
MIILNRETRFFLGRTNTCATLTLDNSVSFSNAYAIKDLLKKDGYKFHDDRTWKKEFATREDALSDIEKRGLCASCASSKINSQPENKKSAIAMSITDVVAAYSDNKKFSGLHQMRIDEANEPD